MEIPQPVSIPSMDTSSSSVPSANNRTIDDSLGFLNEMKYVDQDLLEIYIQEETKKFEEMKIKYAALDLLSPRRMSLDRELLEMQEKLKAQVKYLAFLNGLLE